MRPLVIEFWTFVCALWRHPEPRGSSDSWSPAISGWIYVSKDRWRGGGRAGKVVLVGSEKVCRLRSVAVWSCVQHFCLSHGVHTGQAERGFSCLHMATTNSWKSLGVRFQSVSISSILLQTFIFTALFRFINDLVSHDSGPNRSYSSLLQDHFQMFGTSEN